MDITSWCFRIGKPGSLAISLRHFVIGNLDTFLCLVTVGRPFQMTSGVMSLDYSVSGGHPNLVHFSIFFFFLFFLFFYFFIIFFFASSNPDACFFFFLSVKVRPKFKSRYKGRIKDASDYAKNLKLQRSDILRCLLGKEIVNNALNPS